MSELKQKQHTPGPWEYGARTGHGIEICAEDGSLIASCPLPKYAPNPDKPSDLEQAWSDEVAANARLIAAVPCLLDACKAMIEWDAAEKSAPPYDSDGGADYRKRIELCERAFDLALAAIAKAKGGGA